jgi:hypothetical protein
VFLKFASFSLLGDVRLYIKKGKKEERERERERERKKKNWLAEAKKKKKYHKAQKDNIMVKIELSQ